MDYQKSNRSISLWILNLISSLLKKGKWLKYEKIIYTLLKRIMLFNKNLYFFFKKIENHLYMPLKFINKIIAGRKVLIPYRIKKHKEIRYIIKFIIKNLEQRTEKKIIDRLYLELIDIYKKKGISINKHIQFCKELKENLPNVRFLKI